ncbi:MAG: DUF4350 domain-containing protein [Planctomycetota bacterium]|jgi:hypothetical protein
MRRTDGILALGLVIALVAGVVILGTVGSRGADPFEVRRSSYLTTPTGTKGLHDLLTELGYDVRRHRDDLSRVPGDAGTLLMLSPPVAVGRDEIRGIISWVEGGGTLVLGLGGGRMRPLATAANRTSPAAALPRALGVWAQPTPVTQVNVRPQGFLKGAVRRVRFRGGYALAGPALHRTDLVPLVTSPHGVVAMELPRARGRILVFADDTPFTNRTIRHPDNAQMLVRLLAPQDDPRPILFDETHQGYGRDRDAATRLASALSETGLFVVMLQAALAAAAMLYLTGRRFGAPMPPSRARRRSAVEAAEALGQAYRSAAATGLAAATVAAGARRRAAPRIGIPPTIPPAEFRSRLVRSRHPGAVDLADALERLESIEGGSRGEEAELAAATQAVEKALAIVAGRRTPDA